MKEQVDKLAQDYQDGLLGFGQYLIKLGELMKDAEARNNGLSLVSLHGYEAAVGTLGRVISAMN